MLSATTNWGAAWQLYAARSTRPPRRCGRRTSVQSMAKLSTCWIWGLLIHSSPHYHPSTSGEISTQLHKAFSPLQLEFKIERKVIWWSITVACHKTLKNIIEYIYHELCLPFKKMFMWAACHIIFLCKQILRFTYDLWTEIVHCVTPKYSRRETNLIKLRWDK